jgi:hypothetical protein
VEMMLAQKGVAAMAPFTLLRSRLEKYFGAQPRTTRRSPGSGKKLSPQAEDASMRGSNSGI